jgi:hypothetical protein
MNKPMKNVLIMLGLISSTTVAFGQAKSSPIVQKGNNNVVKMEIKGNSPDTLGEKTRIITQKGKNQIHIESTTTPDSLRTTLENVAIEQQGKGNVVSIESNAGKGNTVSVSQSGSGNTVSIKQN